MSEFEMQTQNQSFSESEFTGTAMGVFGRKLVILICFPLIILTVGLVGAALAIWFQKWIARNTYISGKQLEFEASFVDLWVKKIIWMILSVITLGLYIILGFYFVAYQKWITRNTRIAQ